METQGGFAKTMWCGELECELKMKEEAGVSSRCIPLEQEKLGDVCACCGRPARHMVLLGRGLLKTVRKQPLRRRWGRLFCAVGHVAHTAFRKKAQDREKTLENGQKTP